MPNINAVDEESKIGMEYQQGGLSADPPVAERSKRSGDG